VKRALPILAIALLALSVRLPGLGRSLFYDELFTLVRFADTPLHALFAQRQANNHPLASLLALLARHVSEDPRVLRAPFALLGALSVLAVAWLAGKDGEAAEGAPGGAPRLALGPTLILALLHPAHVGASQEVRGYAALLLAVPLACGLALEGKRPRLLAIAVALGLLAHLTFAPVVLALALLAARERSGRTAAALGAGSLAALVFYLPMLSHLAAFARESAFAGGPDGFLRAVELLGVGDGRLLHPAWAVPFLALAALGARRAPRVGQVTLAAALLAALALGLLRPLFYARFALFLLPLLLALAGHGAAALARTPRGALLVALPLAAAFALGTWRRAHWETEPIGPALALVRAREPGARFVFSGIGAELMPSESEPTHRVELFAREADAASGVFERGLYANVLVVRLGR
jgi:hypothetical protein